MATYIFDFDGTIADSFSLACDILIKQAKNLGCKQITPIEAIQLKEMHAREVLQYLSIPFWKTGFFVHKMRKFGRERVNEIIIFPEWPMILKQLKENQHQIGMISSNSRVTIDFILKKYDMDESFDFIFCDKSLFGKKQCLKKLINQKNLNPKDTYYIGDEVRDIEAAQANNIHDIAVSWGFNSITRLKLARPEQLIMNIDQLYACLVA